MSCVGGGIESELSDRLWLSLNPAFAKPNNCLRPPALNEGCGKSILIKNPGTHTLLGPVKIKIIKIKIIKMNCHLLITAVVPTRAVIKTQ